MSLQARVGDHLLDPNRDMAHNFPATVEFAFKMLAEERWKELATYLRREGYPFEAVKDAVEKYALLVRASLDTEEDFATAFKTSGWEEVPEPLKIAISATVGAVLTTSYFHWCREAALGSLPPLRSRFGVLTRAAKDTRWLLGQPRWRRTLIQMYLDLIRAVKFCVGQSD